MKLQKVSSGTLKKFKWGVAGCGKIAEEAFLPTLQLLKKSKLTAVYSHKPERAKAIGDKFGTANYFSDYSKFLESDFQAVYISSINSDHYWQVIEAAKAGKHILCEKPMAINSQQAEEMIKICEENNVQIAINFTQRFHPLVKKARELISQGIIGKIVSVQINFNIDLPPSQNFRFKIDKSGGGALRDLGTHAIDLLRFFGSEIVEINGYADNVIYNTEVDDFATGIVKFKKSGYGYFNVSYNSEKAFNRIEILGYKGSISLDKIINYRNAPAKLSINLKGEGKKAFRKRANKFAYRIKSFQKSVLNNEVPEASGHDGLINLKLMEELEKNAAKRRTD
ncbi:MAG: Gfo/Idh/MocA family oxidoreductase [Melioribacteraceae bacterium]|nr:Gfo/Idh/MocA family oxidoreductase [Melioribacteraceae bacterium]